MATASVAAADESRLTAEALWGKVLELLDEPEGAASRSQVEQVLGVRLDDVDHASDTIRYSVPKSRETYFSVTYIEYTDRFKSLMDPAVDGRHSQWSIGFKDDAFGDPAKGECITASRIRTDLISHGWHAPWPRWGIMEETPVIRFSSAFAPPPHLPSTFAGFVRQAAADAGDRDRLPRGSLFTTGDYASSCLEVITLTFKLR